VRRKLKRVIEQTLLDLRGDAVSDSRLVAGLFQKPLHAFLFQSSLYIVVMSAAYSKLPASIADVTELFGKLHDVQLASNDILLSGHDVLLWLKSFFS